MLYNSLVAAQLAASEEILCYIELVTSIELVAVCGFAQRFASTSQWLQRILHCGHRLLS
jgi:hypothetical protein